DGGCPDNPICTKVRLVFRAIEQQPYRDEVLRDEALDRGVRIRHGIQREAPCSGLLRKIGQNEASLAVGSPKSAGYVCFPHNDVALHGGPLSPRLCVRYTLPL